MTGYGLARKLVGDGKILSSSFGNYFNPATGLVYLVTETAIGNDGASLLSAAHECEHLRQWERFPWLFDFRWFTPVNLWLEWRANRAALRVIEPYLYPEEMRRCQRLVWRRLFTYL